MSRSSGGRPLQTFQLEGTRHTSVPPPAFDAQCNGVCNRAHGHQRCQFVQTIGVAKAWGIVTNFVWGRRIMPSQTDNTKIYISPQICDLCGFEVTLFKINKSFFAKIMKE